MTYGHALASEPCPRGHVIYLSDSGDLTIIIFSILLPVGKERRLVEPDRIYPDPDRVCRGVGERLEVSVLGVQKWRRYVHEH